MNHDFSSKNIYKNICNNLFPLFLTYLIQFISLKINIELNVSKPKFSNVYQNKCKVL